MGSRVLDNTLHHNCRCLHRKALFVAFCLFEVMRNLGRSYKDLGSVVNTMAQGRAHDNGGSRGSWDQGVESQMENQMEHDMKARV